MRWYGLWLMLLLLAEGGQSSQAEISMEEQLKYMSVKLNTMAAQHTIENAAMRKELDNLRYLQCLCVRWIFDFVQFSKIRIRLDFLYGLFEGRVD